MKDLKVDIVLPWVDGSDKEWIEKKDYYLKQDTNIDIDAGENRYRDWESLKYVLRSIEKFAPWVNKVFFITDHQIPNWLNTKNEKLVVVNHEEYMPKEFLPTFSANPIELNLHRIADLSEHFVYLNDDFFFTRKTTVKDFFVKGLPRLVAMEKPKTITNNMVFDTLMANDIREILKHFKKKTHVKRKYWAKWYNMFLPIECFFNIFYDMTARTGWAGFYMDHLPAPFLKSKIAECWNVFTDKLTEVSKNKFRSSEDINQYLFTEHLLCTGNFYPDRVRRRGNLVNLDDVKRKNIDFACEVIKKQKYKTICLNDSNVENFEEVKNKINSALDYIMPEKSSFEL